MAIMAMILGQSTPDPRFSSSVELSCRDASGLLNLIRVGETLTRQGIATEQSPPALLQVGSTPCYRARAALHRPRFFRGRDCNPVADQPGAGGRCGELLARVHRCRRSSAPRAARCSGRRPLSFCDKIRIRNCRPNYGCDARNAAIGAMPCWGKSPAWLPIYDQASINFTCSTAIADSDNNTKGYRHSKDRN
jgi:hypothetical protein